MKKTGMTLLAALLAVFLSTVTFASEEKQEFPNVGMNIAIAQEMEKTTGLLLPYPLGAIDDDHHVYAMAFIYVALPKDKAITMLYSPDVTEEEALELNEAKGIITMLLVTETGFDDAKKVCDMSFHLPLDYEAAEEIGSAGSFTFYTVLSENDAYLSSIGKEFAEEFKKLQPVVLEAERNADFYEPADAVKKLAGQKLTFTTTDPDGNTVTSEELFSENEITMLNCWGIWCPNCTAEMADLAEIHARMQEKGCGIVGLEWEKTPDEATYREAAEFMEQSGATYPNVLLPEELLEQINAYPTSIFVDREGTILGMPIIGADVNQYESRFNELLGEGETVPVETEDDMEAAGVYHVTVSDEEGPVEGVFIQFCDDTTCSFEKTDADGKASFEAPAGKEYEVHVLMVPEGYKENTEVYHATDTSDEISIQLQKQN